MSRYSPFVNGIVSDSTLLQKLRPSESSTPVALIRIREAANNTLADGKVISNATLFTLVRGGMFYAVDALEDSYRIANKIRDETGFYWQGMLHRRQADFENARRCFRSIGGHPAFDEMHQAATAVSPDMAKQSNWDPYLFVGMCEQEKFGAMQHRSELVKLQRIEFDAMFDYVWRKSLV